MFCIKITLILWWTEWAADAVELIDTDVHHDGMILRCLFDRRLTLSPGKTIQRQKSCLAYRPKVATQTSTFKPIVGKQIDRLLTGSDAWKLCKTLKYIEIVRPCYLDRNKTFRYTCIVIFEIKRLKYINNWVLLLNYPTLSIHECQNNFFLSFLQYYR